MKKINSYILEKLKLNDNIKVNENELIPTENDFNSISDILSTNEGAYIPKACYNSSRRVKTATSAIRKYIAILVESGSSLVKQNNWLYSFPGNYGNDFLLKAKELSQGFYTFNIDNIYEAWKEAKLKHKDNYDKYIKDVASCIDSLMKMLSKSIVFGIDGFEEDKYSEVGKRFILKGYDFVSVPFHASCRGKTVNCEITVHIPSKHYYSYIINGKEYHTYSAFLEALGKMLN